MASCCNRGGLHLMPISWSKTSAFFGLASEDEVPGALQMAIGLPFK